MLSRNFLLRSDGCVAVAVTLLCLLLSIHSSEAAEHSAPTHRIVCCNIRQPMEEDATAGNGWDDRRDLCADVIAAHRGDVICLQECRMNQLTYLKDRLPEYDSYGLSNPVAEFTPNNSILFSRERYELISAGGYWLSETPHIAGSKSWDSAAIRFTNWVHLRERETGRELRVWNTHLDHEGHVAREEQARRLVEGVAAMDAAGVPQILAGDMNAHREHPAIRVLEEGGFTDTYGAIHGSADPGRTYHGFLGPQYAERHPDKGRGRKIDWIFTRGAVQTHAAEIVRDGRQRRYPSDHYFLWADISLPE